MPRLLDLFSGAGGAAMGYHHAGFDVVGVDARPQPNYPFEFHQGDALEFLEARGREFDAIHASPPCQAFTQMSARYRGKGGKADSHPNLLTPFLQRLRDARVPMVVENVPGAARVYEQFRDRCSIVTLRGGMFGLGVHRPRLFASNVLLLEPSWSPRTREPIGVYGHKPDGRTLWRRNNVSIIRAAKSVEEARAAMGIDWMAWDEIREAIPPAYTEFLGRQLMRYLRVHA